MVTPLMKTLNGIINFDSILLAEVNPNEGNTSAQTPNPDAQEPSPSSTSPEGPENEDSNLCDAGIRDATASVISNNDM